MFRSNGLNVIFLEKLQLKDYLLLLLKKKKVEEEEEIETMPVLLWSKVGVGALLACYTGRALAH